MIKFQIFWMELRSSPGKIQKLSLVISSKKLPWVLRNSPTLHRYGQIFRKWGILFHKSKNFWKTENFSGWEFPALAILFERITKFWAQIPPFRPEIQALLFYFNANIIKKSKFFSFFKCHLMPTK